MRFSWWGVGGVGERQGALLIEDRGADICGAVIVTPPPPARSKGGVERRNEYRSTHRFDTTFIMLSFIMVIHSLYMLFVACTQHLPCVCG